MQVKWCNFCKNGLWNSLFFTKFWCKWRWNQLCQKKRLNLVHKHESA